MTTLDWLTVEQAAEKCFRSVGTIRNLLSKHQLPVKRAWIVKNRLRKRTVLLAPETVRKLQTLTLFAPTRTQVRATTKKASYPTHHEPSHDDDSRDAK